MDLPMVVRALWRHKLVLLVGLVSAVVAATLSSYDVSGGKLESREVATYESTARILITSPIQPLFATQVTTPAIVDAAGQPLDVADSYDVEDLAEIYAFLLVSDELESRIPELETVPDASLTARRRSVGPDENADADTNATLPILEIVAGSTSRTGARELAEAATAALLGYVDEQQRVADVPPPQRVGLTVLDAAGRGRGGVGGSSGTVAVVFIGVLVAFVALVLSIENAAQRDGALPRAPRGAESSVAGSIGRGRAAAAASRRRSSSSAQR